MSSIEAAASNSEPPRLVIEAALRPPKVLFDGTEAPLKSLGSEEWRNYWKTSTGESGTGFNGSPNIRRTPKP